MSSLAMQKEAQTLKRLRRSRTAVSISRPRRPGVAAGDLLAFQRDLRLTALRLAGDPSAADDLVQDTLERALRHQARLRPRSNLRGWLMTILRNLAVDRSRRQRRLPVVESIGPHRDVPAAAEPSVPRWFEITPRALREAVAQLEAPFRQVYEMHAFEKRSYGEIAAALGVRKATVGTRLHRARQKLRALLERRLPAP
jgi:RNA polymerase sigma-70 factor (ECF subfamily)